jgi:hypothetical protein
MNMNLVTACKYSQYVGEPIYRKSLPEMLILPTDTENCCVVSGIDGERKRPRWNPRLDDLIAEDWAVRGYRYDDSHAVYNDMPVLVPEGRK